MAIRVYKPTTAGRRNASVSDFSELTRSTPEKSLVRKKSKTGGRNSYGRITSRHRGGGHKRQYRLIDFKRWDKDGVPAKVAEIEYDPNRSARIALLHFADGEKRYIIAPKGIKQGDVIETGAQADIKPGNNLPLKNIPTGTVRRNPQRRRALPRYRRRGRQRGPRQHSARQGWPRPLDRPPSDHPW